MSGRHKDCHNEILKILGKVNPPTRKSLLKTADKALIYSICELCDNTLAGNIPLTPSEKQKLAKYKKLLRNIARRGESWKKKRAILVQRGGAGPFIPLLLSIIGPAIGKLIFGS